MLSSQFMMSLALATSAVLLAHVECGRAAIPSRQRSASPKRTAESTNYVTTSANGNPGTTRKTVSKDGGTVTTESASDRVSPDGRSRSSSKATTTTSSSVSPNGRGRTSSPVNGNKRPQETTAATQAAVKNGAPTEFTSSDFARPNSRNRNSASATAQATSSTNGPNSVTSTANGNPGTVKKTINKDGSTTLESTIENVGPDGKSFSKSWSSTTSNSRS